MPRRLHWIVAPLLVAGLAGCGVGPPPPLGAGQAASINLSLTTVPTVRSVTISPATARFAYCGGGSPGRNTASTVHKLGFPNGSCSVGSSDHQIYPITIINSGIASYIYVNGSSANPSDDLIGWNLCTTGTHPAVACSGANSEPGTDQFQLNNFSAFGSLTAGLTGFPRCDREFGPAGSCWALEGTWQREGIELIGPAASSDTSTKWTVTITWTPVPRQG
jgi:hypothetical protein